MEGGRERERGREEIKREGGERGRERERDRGGREVVTMDVIILLVPGMITLLSGFIMSHGLQMQSCLSGVGRNDILTGL